MHQALYRKWRPKTFEDVCGQEHITSVLRYEVEKNAVSHRGNALRAFAVELKEYLEKN